MRALAHRTVPYLMYGPQLDSAIVGCDGDTEPIEKERALIIIARHRRARTLPDGYPLALPLRHCAEQEKSSLVTGDAPTTVHTAAQVSSVRGCREHKGSTGSRGAISLSLYPPPNNTGQLHEIGVGPKRDSANQPYDPSAASVAHVCCDPRQFAVSRSLATPLQQAA
ncbi:hypothetical protein HRG_000429 [Hirsutella rhossiliensis]|uniref:Uncharacterized protein n=1 Tax=Hirsutella rhossiliensis TaxID=111463 RepID=A0A9P8N6C1_9HYPO|nr:uncharacterized protein HRG_00429 [Hirsutella rhossiliensis]KAH0967787.1 hypothetical protein HRG_00429 [Hirsutella rhossiliensis]